MDKVEERTKKAQEFRESHGLTASGRGMAESEHFLVEIERIRTGYGYKVAQLIADDSNQVFTQIDKGKFKNPFTDETLEFAEAYLFANHPCDDIENELKLMGISVTEKVKEIATKDGIEAEIVREIETPIHFEIKPIIGFIDEWKRNRHAVNRMRVKELIDLVTGQASNQLVAATKAPMQPAEPMVRGRVL